MPRKKKIISNQGDSYEEIPQFQHFWMTDAPDGHEIKIAWGDFKNPYVKTIRLKWEDRKRGFGGRSQPK
tara:strand:+ start:221 stop:427 length:207 start_codon:yes stop_codon:yes gene_type:complete